jgi:DNA adenine methylase
MQHELFALSPGSTVAAQAPVNVASVPHRSPFRYPGGKTWFVPAFRRWMQSLPTVPEILVEPFAGGATIALTAVCEGWVDHAVLVELDPEVASVWQVICAGDAPLLAERILAFDLSVEAVVEHLSEETTNTLDLAFKTLLRNRTFHGGILAPGSGLIKSGEAGKGIASRWYPETLARRLAALHLVRHRLTVLCDDALQCTRTYQLNSNCVFFVDPPYTAGGKKAGNRLYTYFELNHKALFEFCVDIKGDFVMTYDNADEVKALAKEHHFITRQIPMKNTHHAAMSELVVGRELSWIQ